MNFVNKYSKTNIGYDIILEISKILGSRHDTEANLNIYIFLQIPAFLFL